MTDHDAFISYSHAKDRAIATALQLVLQKLGKPWYRRRALRVFRDDTSLSATPELWRSIEQALRRSRFFILIASPEAAASKWVGREVAFWLEHNRPDTILIGLTGGELLWDEREGDFSRSGAIPLPDAMVGRFASEPKWVDLRAYRDKVSSGDARFLELGADFAAGIRGMPKEDLLSEEVRQQRRALKLASSAICALLVLAAAALWQWREAVTQRREAVTQSERAERTLAQATETTNQLVYDLAERFRHSGAPASLVRSILDSARALQDQLIDGGYATAALRRSQGAALIATVRTLLTVGDTEGALAAADRARRIFEDLIARGGESAGHVGSVLAITYGQIGDVLYAQGKKDEALINFRLAVSWLERLVAADPSNRVDQDRLAIAKGRVAAVLNDRGRFDDALVLLREALAIRERLAQGEGNDRRSQHALAISFAGIGDVLGGMSVRHRAAGDREGFAARLEEALVSRGKAVAILERLVRDEPSNTAWLRDLAVGYDKVGEILGTQARYVDGGLTRLVRAEDALASYRKSLAVLERLTASDRSNVAWQQDLAFTHRHLGELLHAFGQFDEAGESLLAGLGILLGLPADRGASSERTREVDEIAEKMDDVILRLILARAFPLGLRSADRALAVARERMSFQAGRAHSLMFLDRTEEARALYFRFAGRRDVRRARSWNGVIAEDFARFRRGGLTSPLMNEIEATLATRE